MRLMAKRKKEKISRFVKYVHRFLHLIQEVQGLPQAQGCLFPHPFQEVRVIQGTPGPQKVLIHKTTKVIIHLLSNISIVMFPDLQLTWISSLSLLSREARLSRVGNTSIPFPSWHTRGTRTSTYGCT